MLWRVWDWFLCKVSLHKWVMLRAAPHRKFCIRQNCGATKRVERP